MSTLITGLTLGLLTLPVLFAIAALRTHVALNLVSALLVLLYAAVWLGLRPRFFQIDGTELRIEWPLYWRSFPRGEVASMRVVSAQELRGEVGWGARVGAGGLWGGFGFLWTSKRGLAELYVSRTDRFVWIERRGGRPLLITPERPDEFVRRWDQAG
jgi:hypothetical protein